MLARLLALLEAAETDGFAAHIYQSRRQYRRTSERPNKGNKAIERTVLSSYQIAQSLGFNGDFRAWEPFFGYTSEAQRRREFKTLARWHRDRGCLGKVGTGACIRGNSRVTHIMRTLVIIFGVVVALTLVGFAARGSHPSAGGSCDIEGCPASECP
jgi:hypothetical protein